jgi:hypothetical protein
MVAVVLRLGAYYARLEPLLGHLDGLINGNGVREGDLPLTLVRPSGRERGTQGCYRGCHQHEGKV